MEGDTPQWHSTCLRVADSDASVAFYTKNFGMVLAAREKSDTHRICYLVTPHHKERDQWLSRNVDSPEALKAVHNARRGLFFLKLVHTIGTESPDYVRTQVDHVGRPQVYASGNADGVRGFGHIAFNCNDIVVASEKLEKNGVAFKKRPHEGNMKTIAFCLDVDGYFVELVGRDPTEYLDDTDTFNLSQTMLRVSDAKKETAFFSFLHMGEINVMHFDQWKFSVYFLATPTSKPHYGDWKRMWDCALEFTHNHGSDEVYVCGKPIGFVNTAFTVESVKRTQKLMEKARMGSNLRMINDTTLECKSPTGYVVQFIQRPA